VADILNILADAHLRLSEGQGAELMWRDSHQNKLTPLDALKIYALKTAPAFEAAILCGLRLAEPTKDYVEPVRQFSRHLGVAFQILNDLKDWTVDNDNKLTAGGDVLGGRPTLLLALALDGLSDPQRSQLTRLVTQQDCGPSQLSDICHLYQTAAVFDKAQQLVDKHRERAQSVADQIEPEPLRRLLHFLIDTVLDDSEIELPKVIATTTSKTGEDN
jgi:geranylgeranyl pyrophosphate synthase